MKQTPHNDSETRELTDKELNKMTRAMGDDVRSQSLVVAKIITENLKMEFSSRRLRSRRFSQSEKTCDLN